jgi:hypothetical protein
MYVRKWTCGCEVVSWPGSTDNPEEFPCDEAKGIIGRMQDAANEVLLDLSGAEERLAACQKELDHHHAASGPAIEEAR